jgi:hypothetical protein
MSITVAGLVKNGVVVHSAPLPEGALVESVSRKGWRKLPSTARRHASCDGCRGSRDRPFLAAAAELAEPDYRSDNEFTGFEAFDEEADGPLAVRGPGQ